MRIVRSCPPFLRVALGVSLVVMLLLFVDLRGVMNALLDITSIDLVIIFALSLALVWVSVLKWRLFLERLGISASVLHLFRLYLVGYFVNLIMPSAIGGDVVRSLYVGRDVDKMRAMSATLLERFTGFLAMVTMALVALSWAPQITHGVLVATVAIGVAAVGLTAVLITGTLVRVCAFFRMPETILGKLARLQEGVQWGLTDRPLLIRAGLLSLVFHLLTIVNTVAVAHAVGWDAVPWSDLLVVVPLILLVGAIPISPQGLGIQEGAFLFFLHSVGATTGQALAVALVLRAKSYVLALCGGLLWLTLVRANRIGVNRAKQDALGVEPEYPSE